jgi:hypothetical protein
VKWQSSVWCFEKEENPSDPAVSKNTQALFFCSFAPAIARNLRKMHIVAY